MGHLACMQTLPTLKSLGRAGHLKSCASWKFEMKKKENSNNKTNKQTKYLFRYSMPIMLEVIDSFGFL